jgi:hypothetical protein
LKIMANASKKASGAPKSVMAKRYASVAEIKRDLFPVAAAEEAAEAGQHSGGYERLMDEFFGLQRQAAAD